MKLIKKTILGVLVLILTGLIILFTISVDLKNVIVNGVIMEIVKTQITSIGYKEGNREEKPMFEYTTDNEQVNEILRSKEVQDLVKKYVDLTVESMIDEESIDEIDLEQDMINYIRENKEVLEEKTGVEITEEMIQETEEQIKEQDINQTLKTAIKETKKNLTETQKKTLKGYNIITSLKLKIIIIILIILDSIGIFFIERKDFKWVYVLGSSIFSAGIGINVMSLIVNIIISKMASVPILKLSILFKHGIIEIILGIVIMISYKIINKKINKTKEDKKDELSKFIEFSEY